MALLGALSPEVARGDGPPCEGSLPPPHPAPGSGTAGTGEATGKITGIWETTAPSSAC